MKCCCSSILTTYLVLCSYSLLAQDWRTINANNPAAFVSTKSHTRGGPYDPKQMYTVTLAAVDTIAGVEITTFANEMPPCYFAIQQYTFCDSMPGDWLGKKLIRENGYEHYVKYSGDTVHINTYASLGDTWLLFKNFNYLDYYATVTSVDTMTVNSMLDSIKRITITLYDTFGNITNNKYSNTVLTLSKNNGWLGTLSWSCFPEAANLSANLMDECEDSVLQRMPDEYAHQYLIENLGGCEVDYPRYKTGTVWQFSDEDVCFHGGDPNRAYIIRKDSALACYSLSPWRDSCIVSTEYAYREWIDLYPYDTTVYVRDTVVRIFDLQNVWHTQLRSIPSNYGQSFYGFDTASNRWGALRCSYLGGLWKPPHEYCVTAGTIIPDQYYLRSIILPNFGVLFHEGEYKLNSYYRLKTHYLKHDGKEIGTLKPMWPLANSDLQLTPIEVSPTLATAGGMLSISGIAKGQFKVQLIDMFGHLLAVNVISNTSVQLPNNISTGNYILCISQGHTRKYTMLSIVGQ
ncbi:MAG: hypothetical protein RL660_967 [Bacteroidota bacterium]|jgi:hypothetical protein